jgi:hypothetical protein
MRPAVFLWQEIVAGAFYAESSFQRAKPRRIALDSWSFSRILPVRNATLWKGVGLGVMICVLLILVVARTVPVGMKRAHMAYSVSRFAGGGGGGNMTGLALQEGAAEDTVHADGPKVVYKAQLNLQVANCADARKKIEDIAAAESGFLESSTLEENSAKITLRVPSGRFDAVRGKLRGLAIRVREDSVSAADVTKQYVDREARLRNLRAEEQQFLAIMKNAHSVPDVLAVTKELSEVRGEIERADAEFRHLKDEIEMAAIEVDFSSETAAGVHWAPGSSLRSAWDSLLQSLADLADFLIWLVVNIPLLVRWGATIFVLVAVGWYVLRKAVRVMRAIFGKKTPAVPLPGA